MKLTIELDREADGRWIAEVPELNILLYGDSKPDAIQRAQSAIRDIVTDRIAHGEFEPQHSELVLGSRMSWGERLFADDDTRPGLHDREGAPDMQVAVVLALFIGC